jgi:hypothetical protein
MVLGAARRMGGCGDALFTALVLPAAVFLAQPLCSATAATAAAVYIFVSLIKLPPPPPRFAVTLWACNSHWPISIRSWGESRGDESRKP